MPWTLLFHYVCNINTQARQLQIINAKLRRVVTSEIKKEFICEEGHKRILIILVFFFLKDDY